MPQIRNYWSSRLLLVCAPSTKRSVAADSWQAQNCFLSTVTCTRPPRWERQTLQRREQIVPRHLSRDIFGVFVKVCGRTGELASICILCALVSTFASECAVKKWTAPARRQLQVLISLYCNEVSCHCSTGLERNSWNFFDVHPPPLKQTSGAAPVYSIYSYVLYTGLCPPPNFYTWRTPCILYSLFINLFIITYIFCQKEYLSQVLQFSSSSLIVSVDGLL